MDASLLKLLDRDVLARVAAEASASPRRRKNFNFHDLSDAVQRFINVLQPGTYVRPHRHLRPEGESGFECFLVLQGAIGFIVLDAGGNALRTETLRAGGPTFGLELAEGQFHTLIALEPDSAMFEIKEGPYIPASDKDFLPQFPAEGTDAARAQVRAWEALFQATDRPAEQ